MKRREETETNMKRILVIILCGLLATSAFMLTGCAALITGGVLGGMYYTYSGPSVYEDPYGDYYGGGYEALPTPDFSNPEILPDPLSPYIEFFSGPYIPPDGVFDEFAPMPSPEAEPTQTPEVAEFFQLPEATPRDEANLPVLPTPYNPSVEPAPSAAPDDYAASLPTLPKP